VSWNPQQYLKFSGERMRPIVDLMARVPIESPRRIVDLGCGTGTLTGLLHNRWPQAHVTGVDNSAAMLERARTALPDVEWQQADLAAWMPKHPVDLLASNAALHWLDDHATLFPRLLAALAPNGMLAVQMPSQHEAPSHSLGFALAESPRWRDRLHGKVRRRPVLTPAEYDALLRPHCRTLDIWTTEYLQSLSGEHPVAEFTKGSFVGVWLAALDADEACAFEADYRARIAEAYPRRADGITLFPFKRLFIVAQR
jgi:trans-aconitate 2-methyltransferase